MGGAFHAILLPIPVQRKYIDFDQKPKNYVG